MALIETQKYDKKSCVDEFIRDLIQGNGVDIFRKYSLNGELDKYHIRGMAWKIFMEVLPETETLDQWVDTLDKLRNQYKTKTKTILKTQKFKGDPLSGMAMDTSGNKTWNTYYADNDTKKLINLDLDRTFQELAIFHQSKVKSNLCDILFIWSKENSDVGYQQGMNDILAVSFLALYPCYFKNTKKLTKDEIIKLSSEQISAIDNAQDIYDFFHDEDELYCDLYYCFTKLMKRGLKELFEAVKGSNKNLVSYKKYQLFTNQWEEEPTDDLQNPLNIRCTLIIKEKLKSIDPDLYQHFKKIGLSCTIFLQRWLKCMFDREFELKDIFTLWDAIFCTPDSQNGYGLVFLDYIALSMILRIRKQLLESDQNECFTTLFKYPTIENISELVIFSNNLQIAIEEMLHGKRSVFLDKILGISRPDDKKEKKDMNTGNMAFIPQNYGQPTNYNYNFNNFNNTEDTKENKGFFKNAMNSMGDFFSNMKQKIEQKMEKKPSGVSNNSGEIMPFNYGNNDTGEIKSLKDCAQRIDAIFEKYKSNFSVQDINEYKAICQYLNNYN